MKKTSPKRSSDKSTVGLTDRDGRPVALGAALRRAWIAYQQRLDAEMAAAGFADRRFPDGRVLRLCAGGQAVTASQIGRELGITRQGAGKLVNSLRDRGYITLGPTDDARENALILTDRAHEYLAAQRAGARRIEHALYGQLGDEAFAGLTALLTALGADHDQPRLSAYLTRIVRRDQTGGC